MNKTEERLSDRQPLVDASVHVFFKGNAEIREWLDEPWKSRGIGPVEMSWYSAPDGEYAPTIVDGASGSDDFALGGLRKSISAKPGEYPGSDPRQVGLHLFGERGVDIAILHPMTRGVYPDFHLGTAILAAHNQMLADRWLGDDVYGEQFRGTIRVNPDDIDGALNEIERWADHPRMVQIGVPLQSREPYGRPQFRPLWKEAARRGLPVAVHTETGHGISHPPTPSGHPRTYPQYAAFMPLNYIYHLLNMITEGVFEDLTDFRIVWADGGAEMLTPFMWRMDTFGRPHLEQTPWAPQIPSAYLPDHVWFVHSCLDGVGRPDIAAKWLDITGKSDMIIFGSSYPHWNMTEVSEVSLDLTDDQRQKILWRNADRLYSLGLAAATPA